MHHAAMLGFRSTLPLALGLQGGGAHGAFTWGVLDALLEAGRHDLAAASGTSAGALNAIAIAHGLAAGGRDGARAALAAFRTAIGTRVPLDAWLVGPREAPDLGPSLRAWMHWSQLIGATQLNPLGLDPLRDVLAEQIDFERLRRHSPITLFVAATHARSGRLRLFETHELTLDVALASACLPVLRNAVTIDGEPYWDGGYSANPALFPLVTTGVRDLLVVALGPRVHDGVPSTPAEIRERGSEFGFHAAYLRELQLLDDARRCAGGVLSRFGRLDRLLRRLRLHVIDAQLDLRHLDGSTRLIAHLPFLETLRDLGRARGAAWLAGA